MSYTDLKTYQNATIIYDFTIEFCKVYIRPTSRTRDQMEQAARSGKQNLAEGSVGRSLSNNIKLTDIAHNSLKELLEDYQDFLRQRELNLWPKDSAEANAVRALAYRSNRSNRSNKTYKSYICDPEQAANAMVCLINQTTYLLDRQIVSLEDKFIKEGGYRENLARKRLEFRKL
jgi:four helix bundle suffix protein